MAMASETFLRMIPMGSDPWVAIINGTKYSYPAGTGQDVPAEVAVLIDAQMEHEKPKYPAVSGGGGGGGDMLVTVTVIMPADAEAQPEVLADKTFAEIEAAVNAKQNVRAKISVDGSDYYIPLAIHSQGNALVFVSYGAGYFAEIYPDRVSAGMVN